MSDRCGPMCDKGLELYGRRGSDETSYEKLEVSGRVYSKENSL